MISSIKICWMAVFAAFAMALPSQASSIAITYDLTGTGTVVGSTATTLTLDAVASGSIMSGNPTLDASWNPISYTDESVLDFTTNLLHGAFVLTLQDGDTLTGTVDEDQSAPDASPTGTGPFPQTLTFTGGTGAFAGVTGSVSGNGFLGTTDFTVSGSGVLNTSTTPEPTSGVSFLGGLTILILWRCWNTRVHCIKNGEANF
jgi:hypothetical protein